MTTPKVGIPRWTQFMVLILVITILDFSGRFASHPKLQYLCVVIPLTFMLLSEFKKNEVSQLASVTVMATILWLIGMSGVYWGKIVERQTDGALPLIWPLAVLMFASFRTQDNQDIDKGMITIGHLANAISLEGAIARLFYPQALINFSHEKGYLVFFAIAIGVKFKRPSIYTMSILLLLINFYSYPALTYVLCGAAALIVNSSLKGNFRYLRFLLFQFFSIALLYFSTFQIGRPIGFLDASYSFLNRENNTAYREFLIRNVATQISEAPIFGSLFRRSVLIGTEYGGLPVHNDFVTVTLGGGFFCFILYLGIYIIVNLKIYALAPQIVDIKKQDAVLCFAILINSYFFCSSANPISMKPQNGMIVMGSIYCVKVILSSLGERQKLHD